MGRAGGTLVVQAHGLCTTDLCPTLIELLGGLASRGAAASPGAAATGPREILVDLAQATSLDSTFMGVLLMIHGQCADAGQDGLSIVNASPQCRRQLTLVGLDRLVRMPIEPVDLPQIEGILIDAQPLSDDQMLHLVELAHAKLVEADPRNRAKFGPLLDSFNEARRR